MTTEAFDAYVHASRIAADCGHYVAAYEILNASLEAARTDIAIVQHLSESPDGRLRMQIMTADNKTQAIRIYRNATGNDIRTSKEYVESLSPWNRR